MVDEEKEKTKRARLLSLRLFLPCWWPLKTPMPKAKQSRLPWLVVYSFPLCPKAVRFSFHHSPILYFKTSTDIMFARSALARPFAAASRACLFYTTEGTSSFSLLCTPFTPWFPLGPSRRTNTLPQHTHLCPSLTYLLAAPATPQLLLRIKADVKDAMRSKDKERLAVVKVLKLIFATIYQIGSNKHHLRAPTACSPPVHPLT